MLDNDGLVVFIYDESHRDAIARRAPALLRGYAGESELRDRKLERLAREGLLVAYELPQDDPVCIELAVGLRAAATARRSARWSGPQRARLSSPSGTLCIETYSSLRAGPEQPETRGASIEVPPGEYVLELHRNARRRKGTDPGERIVLVPADEAEAPRDAPAMLLFAPPGDRSWAEDARVDGKVFSGRIQFLSDGAQFRLNLDRDAAARLGLAHGMGLRVELPTLGLAIDAIHVPLAAYGTEATRAWRKIEQSSQEFAVGDWDHDRQAGRELLVFVRVKAGARLARGDLELWLPATATVKPAPKTKTC